MLDGAGDFFEPAGVDVVKCGEVLAVDVKHADDIALGIVQGDDNLAAGEAAAGDVAGELLNVGDDDGAVLLPRCATHAAPVLDAVAGNGSLEWTEVQLVTLDEVEACPPPSHGLVQQGGSVGKLPYRVVLALDEALDLLDEELISLVLVHSTKLMLFGRKNKRRRIFLRPLAVNW